MMLVIILLVCFYLNFHQYKVEGQLRNGGGVGIGESFNICKDQKQCGLCNQQRGCRWCIDPQFSIERNPTYDRCNAEEDHVSQGCNLFEEKGNPSAQGAAGPNAGSINPSSYDVNLWVGQRVNISFTYRDPGNKPLDLYYLMDLSQTMADDKDAVVDLGRYFSKHLQDVSKNLRMGFGSFVDKPVMPFAAYSHIHNPGDGNRPVYGFENQLRLTQVDPRNPLFERTVANAKISVNLDAPEGGLDAMMQVMECTQEIGWRDNAHRILVVSTDGTFHIAGDGKLGGIVIPNDGKCHMWNNSYVGSTLYDYPSVSQVISKIREKQIYIIFAVQKEVESLYKTLSDLVSEYASTIRLDAKSTDVGRLVRDQYRKIQSTVEISYKPTLKESELGVTYYAKCKEETGYQRESKCENLKGNPVVEFKVEFELKRCPIEYSDREWNQVIQINPTGSHDSLNVNLHLKCGCNCEIQNTNQQGGSDSACSNHGSIVCGICKCNDGFTGDQCGCDSSVASIGGINKCSGGCGGIRGSCKCGKCVCNEPFTGPNCQWDSRKCGCAPPNSHGHCEGEECKCDDGWYTYPGQLSCACQKSKSGCMKEGKGESEELCTGKGSCMCNKCQCNAGFVGKFCETCHNCRCLNDYVRCAVERDPTIRNNKRILRSKDEVVIRDNCSHVIESNVNITDFYTNVSSFDESMDMKCYSDYDGCTIEYIYNYDKFDELIEISVNRTLLCPPPPKPTDPFPLIIGTIASILFLGILTLLLWKIITYFIDKHEYNKFEMECQNRKWETGGNPLYKGATSTFQNPAYTD